jgi:hypothetical protein
MSRATTSVSALKGRLTPSPSSRQITRDKSGQYAPHWSFMSIDRRRGQSAVMTSAEVDRPRVRHGHQFRIARL